MARPSIASSLPKLPPEPGDLPSPRTKLPRQQYGIAYNKRPNNNDVAFIQGARELAPRDTLDLEFDPNKVQSTATYFERYVPGIKAVGVAPLNILFCNYCWNRWPLIGFMAMDEWSMVKFLRGQCCPICLDDERRIANPGIDSLHRNGPSPFFIEQAQRLGMRTERFPYLDRSEIRFQDIWSTGATNVGYARDLWDKVRTMIVTPRVIF